MTNQLHSMLKFARLHDWGHDARIEGDKLVVGETLYNSSTGERTREWSSVGNMQELRDWAGY